MLRVFLGLLKLLSKKCNFSYKVFYDETYFLRFLYWLCNNFYNGQFLAIVIKITPHHNSARLCTIMVHPRAVIRVRPLFYYPAHPLTRSCQYFYLKSNKVLNRVNTFKVKVIRCLIGSILLP